MTLSSTLTRITYAGDGTTVNFAVPFAFFGADELAVIEKISASGAKTIKALGSHYMVLGGNGGDGTVLAVSPPTADVTWTIVRQTKRTQQIDYTPNDPFPAETHERALDRQAAVSQELDDALSRCAQLSPTTTLESYSLPDPGANLFLRWNGAGDSLENVAIAPVGMVPATETASGIVELASASEMRAGTDGMRATTPAGAAILWRKGADIASATTLARPSDANLGGYHVVTGTAPISGLWASDSDGMEIELRFAAACPLTHHATNFILPGGFSVTAAIGDIARFRSEAGKWRCVSAPPGWYTISFSAHKGGVDQTGIPSATYTKLTFPTEVWDNGGCYDAANSRFTPPAGTYLFVSNVIQISGLADQSVCFVALYKNGTIAVSGASLRHSGTGYIGPTLTAVDRANGNDYYEVYFYGDGAGNKAVQGVATNSVFQAVRVG